MHIVSCPHVARKAGRLAALLVAAVLGLPAAASAASCPQQPTTTPFSQFGDPQSYFLIPGGNLESPLGTAGWLAFNAARTPGNEPFDVGGSADANSLTINRFGVAVSPAFCVDASMPEIRFFAHALGTSGELQMRVVLANANGTPGISLGSTVNLAAGSMTSWAPTAPLSLVSASLLPNGQSSLARLEFNVVGSTSWQVDDIYVDPFRVG